MAVVFVATLAITTGALQLVKSRLQTTIADNQYARLSSIADAVDEKFASRRVLLGTFADSLETATLDSPEHLQVFLNGHRALGRVFDNVIIVDMQGDVVANLVGPKPGTQVNLKDRPHFIDTVTTMAGIISQPYRSRFNGLAQIAITEPVMGREGLVRWIVLGSMNLQQRNFLGELADLRFGKAGYLFIVNTDGLVIADPRVSRVLQRMDVDGAQEAATERALRGFEGTTEGLSRDGVDGLFSFKHLRQTNWIMGAIYPRQEAFAPIVRIQHVAWAGAVVVALLGGMLAIFTVRRQLAPMTRLHGHMRAVHENPDYVPSAQHYRNDEIGDLARTFATLTTERQAATAKVLAQERFLRTVTDNIPALVSHVDASLRYTFGNAHTRDLFQVDDVVGRSMPELRGEADFRAIEPYIRKALAGETVTVQKSGIAGRGLAQRTFKATYVPDIDASGTVRGIFGMTFDVTDEVNARRTAAAQEKRLREVTESIPAIVGYFDHDENWLYGNSRARRAAGIGDAPLAGATLRSAAGPLYAQCEPHIAPVLAGRPVHVPIHVATPEGEIHFQMHLVPDRDLDGVVQGFYLMAFNVTALKQAELRRAESEKRLRGITDNLPALIAYIDRDERFRFANETYRSWLGRDPASLIGCSLAELMSEEAYAGRKPGILRALEGHRVEFDSTGAPMGVPRTTHSVYVPDVAEDGAVLGIYMLSVDVTDLKRVQDQLSRQARQDALTGLPNRLAFGEILPQALARAARAARAGTGLALMFLDIDKFKTINDTLGHAGGDAVLAEFAARLQAVVRTTDTVARLAGDEFLVLLEPVAGREAAAEVAEKIRDHVARTPFPAGQGTVDVSTSIGVVWYPPESPPATAADLIARADAALYAAKSKGRNRFEFEAA